MSGGSPVVAYDTSLVAVLNSEVKPLSDIVD